MNDLVAPQSAMESSSRNVAFSIPSISLVIPTLNEAENLRHVLPAIPDYVGEIIVVDGGSADDTVATVHALCPHALVLHEPRHGKGIALQRGFDAVKGDIVVTIDADGSMDPGEIIVFVGALLAGADFAKGSRFMQGGGTADMEWYRRLGNWGLKTLVRLGFGGDFSDLCYGYNAFWTKAVRGLRVDASGFEVETLINIQALKHKLKISEVPSFEAKRINGSSHLNTIGDGWRVLRTIIGEFVNLNRKGARSSTAPLPDSAD